MRYFGYIILLIVTLLIGQSCSDKVESISEDDTDIQHHATLVLNGSIVGYESSRAQDYNWRDGDKIFLQFFTSNNTRIQGVAYYNAQLDIWNLEYNGNLPYGISAKCEAYYFDKINNNCSAEIGNISVFEDKSAAYLVENGVVSVFAVLSPAVGRIRLKGEPGTKFMVFGFNSITDYDIYSNTFDITEAFIDSEIGNDGYSPYFYGTFPSEENKQLFLEIKSGTNILHTYSQYLGSNALSKGHSGYVTLPSNIDNNGWEEAIIKGSKNAPFTVAEAIEKQGTGKSGWVSGFIVGAVAPEVTEIKSSADIEFTAPTVLANTLVIADAADVKDVTKCIVFWLPQGSKLRKVANLRDYPELLGTKISIKGKFASYMGANGLTGNSGGYDEFFLGDQPSGEAVTAINEGFEGGSIPANWGNVQLQGNKNWFTTSFNNNYYAAMTGYKGTAPFDSWLITPAINMDGVTTKKLSFRTQVNGYGSTTTTMKVFVLTSADPATATRTELNCKWATAPASGYSDWVESGDIDLSSYSGIIYIGFQYAASTDANYATWCVDDVVLGEGGGSTGGGSTGGGDNPGGDISGNSTTLDLSTLGYADATAVTDVNMSDGTVLTFGSGANTTNAPKYYTKTGGVRMYANNTLNVKASGKTITGVKLTCDSYNGTDYVGNDTLNGKSGSTTVNPSVSGTTVTFSGFSGAELLITNAYAQSSGGVQLRVKTVTVYYAE